MQEMITMHRFLTFASIVLSLLVSGLAFGAEARAGDYVVNGTCGAWQAFNHQEDRLASYSECPHLRTRNRSGAFRTNSNLGGAGWHFDAPAGTTIRAVKLDAYITGRTDWYSDIRVVGSPGQPYGLMAHCYGQNPCGTSALAGSFADLTSVVARMWCNDASDGCPNDGAEARASIDIAGSQITLHDPSSPSVAISGGSLVAPGWQSGQRELAIGGLDNTGVRAARALVDGDARHSSTTRLHCDYTRRVPCSNKTTTATVDLRGLPDGQHSVQAQAEDASGNVGNSAARTISVDNTPPLQPVQAHLTGGPGWRAVNNFTITWTNPAQAFAPIGAVGYQVCPQDVPDGGPGCRNGRVNAPSISQLAFRVPGPGAWRIRLWLLDAAGNGTPANGVAVSGLGLLAGRAGHVRTHLSVGKQVRSGLVHRTTVGFAQRVKLVGRLSTGRRRRPLRRRVLVYRKVSVQGAPYKLVKRISTGRHGRFRFRAHAGPSRRLLFVYPGDGRFAGRLTKVKIRVRARLRIHADQKRLRNGETVTLSGRLHGGHVPPGGALLELQVYSRGHWRPFATPRTSAKGRWSYGYRFETVTGLARFRFRAVLRKQPTYPYIARSRAIGVRVRGR